jgi:hypothetical protein
MLNQYHVIVTTRRVKFGGGSQICEPHSFHMGWSDTPGCYPIIPHGSQDSAKIKAFVERELPDALEAVTNWLKEGGKVGTVEIRPIPGYCQE